MNETITDKSFAEQQWQRAASMLRLSPRLMTTHILSLALQHRPPLAIVNEMIRLNPKAAVSSPKDKLTPLQLAVKHNCSVPVVKAVLEAYPYALVAANGGSPDPLAYAKLYRSHEKDLIELLSRPLSHWILNKSDLAMESSDPASTSTKNVLVNEVLLAKEQSSTSRSSRPGFASMKSLITLSQSMVTPTSRLSPSERQELANIKLLCLTVLKGHKRLLKEMGESRNASTPKSQRNRVSPIDPLSILDLFAQERVKLLKDVEVKMQKQFRIQLIALDMKERAMMSQMKLTENRFNASKDEFLVMAHESSQGMVQGCVDQVRTLSRQVKALEVAQRKKQGPRGLVRHLSRAPKDSGKNIVRTFTHKTTASSPENSPIVFATPLAERRGTMNDDDEDVVSLLSEESHRDKKKRLLLTRPLWMRGPWNIIIKHYPCA
jgi:translation initiation factor 2B subunit (eIF-2B alpha/beta/delta family)